MLVGTSLWQTGHDLVATRRSYPTILWLVMTYTLRLVMTSNYRVVITYYFMAGHDLHFMAGHNLPCYDWS
jgi:hypothetical protein